MDYGMDDFDGLDDQPTAFARWVLPALIISILVHVLLFIWLSTQYLAQFFEQPPKPAPTMTFKLERVPLDHKVLEPRVADKPQPAAAPKAVKLPKEKPSFDQMMAKTNGTPAAPKINNPMLADKPQIEATSYTKIVQDAQNGGVKSVSKDLDQVRSELLADKPGITGKPLLDLAKPDLDSGGSPANLGNPAGASTPGFSNLDDLLAETGPLTKETAPIRMDSDVLYTYDSYQLQPQAVESLRKLGLIIQRNPQLLFSIEGHSDSSGSEAYNLQLSQLRAEAVKAWLVQEMSIDPSRITTRGFGSTRLITPATKPFNEEKEALNRRVEIVLHDRNPAPQ